MTMEVMAMEPESLRKLVRRDLVVVCAGGLIAIWSYSLVAAAGFRDDVRAHRGPRRGGGGGDRLGVVCIWWWASGPRGLCAIA